MLIGLSVWVQRLPTDLCRDVPVAWGQMPAERHGEGWSGGGILPPQSTTTTSTAFLAAGVKTGQGADHDKTSSTSCLDDTKCFSLGGPKPHTKHPLSRIRFTNRPICFSFFSNAGTQEPYMKTSMGFEEANLG